jgi:transposase
MIPLLNRGGMMKGFVQGADRQQTTLLPECLDDWVDESNPVRAVDVFVDALELRALGFDSVTPAATGRPGYHPSPMLKLYIYGYLNRVQSSRRLEREAGRNLEVMWLTGRLVPDHKTIADFRKDNGPAIKKVCAQFVALCRKMGLLAKASVAIDGSKFKAVNSRDNNFTKGKMERRLAQIEESVACYLSQLDTADRQTACGEAPSEELVASTTRLKEKLIKLEEEVKRLKAIEKVMLAAPDQQVSFSDPDSRSMATSGRGSGMVGYNVQAADDTTNHLIVAHEVTNVGTDKSHLANMANQAKAALEAESLEAFADRGYFKGEEGISRFITQKLKLKVNEAKSAVARPQERKFLGFSFTAGPDIKRTIAPKSLERFKQRVRDTTRRAKGVSIKTTMEELATYMRGWRGYFGFCETPEVLIALTRWVRLRLRAALWRQWKTPRRRRAALIANGVSEWAARDTAGSGRGPWYLARSRAISTGLSNAYFKSLGLPSLFQSC